MANKQYAIRWRKSDTAELRRVIKNFNAKIYRLRKTRPELAEYLPDTVKVSDTVKSIHTRQEFNRTIKSLQRFSKKGAEKPTKSSRGAKATKWEVSELKKKERIVNRELEKQRNALLEKEVTSRGEGTGQTRAQMGTLKEVSLKPYDVKFENKSQKEWDLMKTAIDKQLNESWKQFKKSNMKLNYIKGLEDAGFYDVAAIVHGMDVDKFIETVETDTEATFDFIYDPIEWSLKNDSLLSTWESASQK